MIRYERKIEKHELTIELNYENAIYDRIEKDYKKINELLKQGYKITEVHGGTTACCIELEYEKTL